MRPGGIGRRGLMCLAGLSLAGCLGHSKHLAATVTASPPLRASASAGTSTTGGPPTAAVGGPGRLARTMVFGRSVDGAPLTVTEVGSPASPNRVLVVGCIHGSEPAGIAIAKALAAQAADPAMRGADYWIVTDLNPDGVGRATRQNAHGVDLNRNFPYLWQTIGAPGTSNYAGTAAGSEPETAAMVALVQRVRPTLAIWFHQHLAVVDDSEGPIAAERRFAALVGLPLAPLTDYPGSAVGWENHVVGATAFVVELPAGELAANQVRRYVGAVTTVAAERSP